MEKYTSIGTDQTIIKTHQFKQFSLYHPYISGFWDFLHSKCPKIEISNGSEEVILVFYS